MHYLASRDDWDGRTLVARGESQGGLQTFAMAALHPKVSAMIATFPAGCDTQGPTPAWPYWRSMPPADRREAIDATSLYYDAAHFAAAVKVPALVTFGLRDVTASPPGVLAAYNALGGPKELLAVPDATQTQSHEPSVAAVDRWYTAIKTQGRPPTEVR